MDYSVVLPSNARAVKEEDNKGTYEIDGLYPGYGHTFGNSLRRILLSSMPGSAVTRVKVEGASHEFATLPGVLEDMITILLNIKQLRFKMHGDEPQIATIEVKGAKDIKGKDIKCPTQLEVLNKDHHIATLTDKNARFTAELTLEKGIGFVPSEELMKDKVSVGTLVLDAIFTPIRRANYEVENMRVGDRTDYNRVRLFIETDGSLTPREALKHALAIMKQQIEKIEIVDGEEGGKAESFGPVFAEANEAGPFGILKISTKAKKALLGAGISSPEILAEKSKEELLALEGVGDKAISEISKALKKIGLSLKE